MMYGQKNIKSYRLFWLLADGIKMDLEPLPSWSC